MQTREEANQLGKTGVIKKAERELGEKPERKGLHFNPVPPYCFIKTSPF